MHEVSQPIPVFLEALTTAVSHLKNRLQQDYEQVYPDLGDIIQFVIRTEEAEAWRLLPLFPHLVLPDLVEAHLAQLELRAPARRSAFNLTSPTASVTA
jgi:hypothetical protein